MGLEADKVSTIIEAHAETVEGLKSQIETFKEDAQKYADTQKALDSATKELESLKATGGDWQKKYDALSNEYESYKTEQTAKEAQNAKEKAYRELLVGAGVSEKRIPSILKVTDFGTLEMENGKFKDQDSLLENIKTEWSDFVTTTQVQGATTPKPINNAPTRYTRDDIAKMSAQEINQNWEAVKASL